jgi:hypothetical protein
MHWVEGHLRGAIPVGRFQGLENLAGGTQQIDQTLYLSRPKKPHPFPGDNSGCEPIIFRCG